MNATIGRWIVFALGLCAVGWIVATALRDSRPEGDTRKVADYKPWEKETVELASLLPVQDGGRVKPLGTFAGFTMLGLHGARSMEIIGKGGETVKIKPLEWNKYGEAFGCDAKYVVYEAGDGWNCTKYPHNTTPYRRIAEKVSQAEAYAAAQSDHDAAIRSALASPPATSPEREEAKRLLRELHRHGPGRWPHREIETFIRRIAEVKS